MLDAEGRCSPTRRSNSCEFICYANFHCRLSVVYCEPILRLGSPWETVAGAGRRRPKPGLNQAANVATYLPI